MCPKIIGHGTWYDKIAHKILIRENTLHRDMTLLRTESGIGASGLPHIGSLADAARSYTVALAIKEQGYNSELIAYSDDMDGLRKVPIGFPKKLEKYLGYPVTSIPDPFGDCHRSYGEHMSYLLMDALDKCKIQYQFISGTDVYKKGLLNDQIEILLKNAKQVGTIIKEEVGQDKYIETLPYFPICSDCGRIYSTKVYQFLPKEKKLLYKCAGMEIKGRWLEGCGNQDEVDYRKGEGKLSWKAGEFAARWATFGINFEAYGKDIADSVRVNDRISREILKYEPPLHVQYEMFLDKTRKKISKSKGNVFTPQVWFHYGSPQSLLLLTLKRFTGTRTLSIADIPQYMTELDELEDVFLGKKKVSDAKDKAKLVGLYKYCWALNPPIEPSTHVPYNLLVYLAKIAPKESKEDYIKKKLQSYGYINESSEVEQTRIHYALNWAEDFQEIEKTKISLNIKETQAIKEFITILEEEENVDKIQGAIFHTARKYGVKPKDFFVLLYQVLIGIPRGPKLGPYIVDIGLKNVINRLKEIV
jgi:lysyl-tRNA synthetase class 1